MVESINTQVLKGVEGAATAGACRGGFAILVRHDTAALPRARKNVVTNTRPGGLLSAHRAETAPHPTCMLAVISIQVVDMEVAC
jgi:hypothetical protein